MGKHKRYLTEEEKNWCQKAIKAAEEDKKDQQYLIEYANLMLTKGLKQNHLRKTAEMRANKKEANRTIHEIDQKIHTLKKQIKYGVNTKK